MCRNMQVQSNFVIWGYFIVTKPPSAHACERVLVAVVVLQCSALQCSVSPYIRLHFTILKGYYMPTAYNVSQAAAVVGVSPSSLRNWCKQYAAYLSPGATPTAGTERILTPADVATLQHIKAQRDALKDYDTIIAELATMPIDAAVTPYIDVQATAAPPEAPQAPTVATPPADVLAAIQALADERYSLLQQRIEQMETKQGDRMTVLVLGIGIGILLTLAAAGLVWLGLMAR